MTRSRTARRRPAVHITLGRAARLHRLVRLLSESSRSREAILTALGIGLRTFYRELELLKRCGVKVVLRDRVYVLVSTAEQAEGRLPFPDPQLSFAEMAELSRLPGEAAQRLARLLESVIHAPMGTDKTRRKRTADRTRRSTRNSSPDES
ncbi:MAG: hypothetical protein U0794_06285 [Isosphaeraceae bacterium]